MNMNNEDDIHDMSIKQQSSSTAETRIQQKLHPGFICFFKDYYNKAAMTFDECYQSLLEGNQKIDLIKTPISQILKSSVNPENKKELLSSHTTSNKKFMYFFKDSETNEMNDSFIDSVHQEENKLKKLHRQLNFYQQRKKDLITEKREEFRIQKEKEKLDKQRMEKEKLDKEVNMNRKSLGKYQKTDKISQL